MATPATNVVRDGAEKAAKFGDYNAEQIQHLKNFIAPGFEDSELAFFLAVAKQKKLDPFTRQIHGVKRKLRGQVDGQWVDGAIVKIDVMTGIDGYRAIAARCGDYAPGDEQIVMGDAGFPVSATVSVRKLVQGSWLVFSATAYFDEYAPYYFDKKTNVRKLGDMWAKMPRRMLTKCAEALALRKGWPEELSDIYASEEMDRAIGDESAPTLFGQLAQEGAALPPAAPVAPQVVSAPAAPVATKAPAQVVDMQERREEAQRPASKPGEALPDLWAVSDAIPASILMWLTPISDLGGKPVFRMSAEELERVVEQVKRGFDAAKGKPKSTQRLLTILSEIANAAQYTLDKKLGAVPPLDDSQIPGGA